MMNKKMRFSFTAVAILSAVGCLGWLLPPATASGAPNWRDEQDDDHFELQAIPLEDAHQILTSTERRPYNPNQEDSRTFGVIVDCGSSGTRAHLYEWDGTVSYPQLLHYIEPMRDASTGKPLSEKFSPSLSSFADDPTNELEKYIKRVLDYIESYIPRKNHPFTGVYILATAGMRLLDDETQARIMQDISKYIEREYSFAKVKTSVISGAHEGMYQWISVNAKAKRFLGQGTNGRTKTFAVIEMGGASTQVTYQLRPGVSEVVSNSLLKGAEARQVYRSQIVEPQLSRRDDPENTYLLHSTTFLGFGSNSAREAYLDLLIHKHFRASGWHKFISWSRKMLKSCFDPTTNQRSEHDEVGEQDKSKSGAGSSGKKNEGEFVMTDPCLPTGYLSEEPLKKPKRLLESKDKILGFLLEEDEPYFTFKVKGSGNYNKCKKYVEEMLKLSKQEKLNCKADEPEKCTMELIGENFIPFDSIDFLGIGDIYYTTNLMIRSAGTYNHGNVVRRTKRICQTSYESLKKQFPKLYNSDKLKSRVSDECFKAVWVDTFLVKGLQMPTDLHMLKTVGAINNDDLEWTLGAVLDKSLAIESAADENAEQIFGPWPRGDDDAAAAAAAAAEKIEEPVETEEEEEELDLGEDDD